jgi:hypothetical protein
VPPARQDRLGDEGSAASGVNTMQCQVTNVLIVGANGELMRNTIPFLLQKENVQAVLAPRPTADKS